MFYNAQTNNQGQLQGRVVSVKELSEGKMAVITLAIDNGKDKDGNKREASFPQVKSFHPNTYNQLVKGMLVRAYTHLSTDKYEKAGETRYSQDTIADCIEFLESKSAVQAREDF